MSIRQRLTLVLTLIVLPVLLLSGVFVAVVLPNYLVSATQDRMATTARAVSLAMAAECISLNAAGDFVAMDAANGRLWTQIMTDAASRGVGQRDVVVVLLRNGKLANASPNAGTPAPTTLSTPQCSDPPGGAVAPGAGPMLASQRTFLTTNTKEQLTVLIMEPLTSARLDGFLALTEVGDARVELDCPGGKVYPSRQTAAGWVEAVAPAQVGRPCKVIASAGAPSRAVVLWGVIGVLAIVLATALALVVWLANQLTEPILAIRSAAAKAAHGDLSVHLDDSRGDELGDLSRDFNHMVGELDSQMTALRDSNAALAQSRDALRDITIRTGEALRRTHDLDGLLRSLGALAATTVGAASTTVWLREGSGLRARVSHPVGGAAPATRRVGPGQSVPARVLATGQVIHGPATGDESTVLRGRALAVPLRSGDQVLGVLVAERRAGEDDFEQVDVESLETIGRSAGVSIDNAMMHRAAQRVSVMDPLTGVGNMRMLTTTLGREIERSRRFGRPLSLLVLDLDRLTKLNDDYGHSVGDGVLRATAERISSLVRSVDTVARFGGEEFAVICPELAGADAVRAAERLVEGFRASPLVVGEHEIPVRVSVGFATWPDSATTGPELVAAADAAMSAAKQGGRDRAQAAPPVRDAAGRHTDPAGGTDATEGTPTTEGPA